jgi:hypothetical protein
MKKALALLAMAAMLFCGACSQHKDAKGRTLHPNNQLAFGATWEDNRPYIINDQTMNVLVVTLVSSNRAPVLVTGIDINGVAVAADRVPRNMAPNEKLEFTLPAGTQIQEIVVHTQEGDQRMTPIDQV